jgi:hypothetical protein
MDERGTPQPPLDDRDLESEEAIRDGLLSRGALQPLRLTPVHADALARRIQAAAGDELARRAARQGRVTPNRLSPIRPTLQLTTGKSWATASRPGIAALLARAAWPAFATAAAAAIAAAGLTYSVGSAQAAQATDFVVSPALAVGAAAQATPVRRPDVAWVAQQRVPTAEDLAQAIGFGVEQ